MANTVIQFKRTNVPSSVPNTVDPSNTQYIEAGEFALNMADGVLYTSNGSADGLIAVGAKQTTFQSTTITVSDTFEIGDITTQLLKANSTTILAGNTTVNATVSTTLIGVQNATSSSTVDPKKIFVGNSSVNAQFNLVAGNADLIIDSFSYDSATSIATFGTTTPHNLVYPPKGTYVTLSNMTGAASPYNGTYEVLSIPTSTTFTIANVTFGGTVAINSTSVSRTGGYSRLLTTKNHGFGNGSQIIVSGVGPDLKDPDFTFDGTFTVVNSIAASNTLYYTQYPIVTASPSYMYKESGDNYITYKTDTPHNLALNYYVSTNAYPTGVSTPITTEASVNSSSFATLVDSGYDRSFGAVSGKAGVGGSVYMLVDSSDTNYKIFNKYQSVPVTLETASATYEDIYTRTITSAFYDPVTLSRTGAVQNIIVTLSTPLYALGGGVLLSGFTGSWSFLNDRLLPISQITTATAYSKIVTNGSYTSAPAYDLLKCYSINVTGIANISTVPDKSLLPFYNTAGASLKVRVPVNMGAITDISKATQMNVPGTSPRYLIRIDTTSASADVSDNSSDISWARDGAYRYGLRTNAKMYYTSTGWNWYGESTGADKRVTITFGVDVSSFSVGQWCLLMGNFSIDWNRRAETSVANIPGTNLGIYQITAVNNTAKTITFDWTYGPKPYAGSWFEFGRGWIAHFFTSDYTWTNIIVQPFTELSSAVQITARMSRGINTATKINSIINSTAFTMPLNSLENTTTTYGTYDAPLPVISGSFVRNTDVGPTKAISRPSGPKSPPAYITYDSTGVVSGDCHIEYSSYVEVTNSSSGVRITPTTFYSGNNSTNLFSNSSTLAISSPTNALQLGTGGFSVTGSTGGKYDPSKPVLSVNSSVLQIGTGLKGITIDGSGRIKQYGSELDIGTEIANVFINEYSITINSNDQQTVINATSSVFPGNVAIGGSLSVGGSYGDIGQVLATDGTSLFWTDNGIDFTVDHTFEANLAVKGTLSPNLIDIIDDVGNDVKIDSDISYYTANTLEQLTITGNTITLYSNDTYSNTTSIKSASIVIGNSTVNSTVNSSSFTGTSNNTLYVGSVTAANVVSNAQLQSNLSNYVTSASLSGTVATLAANSATYVNGKTEGNLNVNSATDSLNANNAAYLGGTAAASYVNTTGSYTLSGVITHVANLSVNGAIIAAGSSGSAGQVLTSNGSGNVYWSTVTSGGGGSGSLTEVDTGNGLTGGPITTTGTISILANSGIVANSTGLFVNSAYIQTLTANDTLHVGSVTAANVVSNAQLQANLAGYSTTTATTANAATAYSNAAAYTDNRIGTANTAMVANADAAYTNAVSYVDGKGYISSIPAAYVQNTDSRTLSGNLYFTGANSYFGGKVTVNANVVINGGVSIIDSTGSEGTAGQILTSNGSGNIYWSTVTSGGTGSVTSVASGNGLSGGPITSTGTLYVLANSGIVSNTTGVFVNTSYIATLDANNSLYLGGVAATNYVTATNLSDNLANYSTTTATTANAATAYSNAASYTDNRIGTANSAMVANADAAYTNAVAAIATSTANNTLYVGTVTAANVVSNSQLQSNLSNYQTTAGLNANIAAYLPTYTGIVNGSSHTVGSAFVANSTQLTITIPFSANGSVGTTGYILASNGATGSPYWRDTTRVNNQVSASSITIDASLYDQYVITSLATDITFPASTTGSPGNGDKMIIRIKDNGTPRGISWGGSGAGAYRAIGLTLPTITTANKVLYIGCVYNSDDSVWDAIAFALQA